MADCACAALAGGRWHGYGAGAQVRGDLAAESNGGDDQHARELRGPVGSLGGSARLGSLASANQAGGHPSRPSRALQNLPLYLRALHPLALGPTPIHLSSSNSQSPRPRLHDP